MTEKEIDPRALEFSQKTVVTYNQAKTLIDALDGNMALVRWAYDMWIAGHTLSGAISAVKSLREPKIVPYFEFTTVSIHDKINNMHDDLFMHRALVEYVDGECLIACSCRATWKVAGINPNSLAIQQSFEVHLKEKT